jgi:hypothetical protein
VKAMIPASVTTASSKKPIRFIWFLLLRSRKRPADYELQEPVSGLPTKRKAESA